MINIKSKWRILVILAVFGLCFSCASASNQTIEQMIKSMPAHNFSSYEFSSEIPLISRVQQVPDFVMAYLKEMDQIESYMPYQPTAEEMSMIEEYLSLLPPLHKEVLRSRLLGIYFVENLLGSGLGDFALDEDNELYTFLVLNPETMRNDISTWMTFRENTCFVQNDAAFRVEVDCGTEYTGLLYILLHEATHVVDYTMRYTPYVEKWMTEIQVGETPQTTAFTDGIWADYSTPAQDADFTLRKDITFYGLYDGPKINISDAQTVYEQWASSRFMSLYGCMSWAEDFAEYVTWYHYSNKLGQPYSIRLLRNDEVLYEISPVEFNGVRSRESSIQSLYSGN
jgi:hypothetical protein